MRESDEKDVKQRRAEISVATDKHGERHFKREVFFCVGTHTGMLQRLIHHMYL